MVGEYRADLPDDHSWARWIGAAWRRTQVGGQTENGKAIEWLVDHCQSVLTTWECDFLDSIQHLRVLSPRQQDKLDQIWREEVQEKRRE